MTTDLSVVFFDAGNTLLRADPGIAEIYVEVASRHGIDRSVRGIRNEFKRVWREKTGMPQPDKGDGAVTAEKVRLWWKKFVGEIFHIEPSKAIFDDFFDELYDQFADPATWMVYDDVRPCLTALKEAGLRLAVLSNWDVRLSDILKGHNLTNYFDDVIISAVEGWEKPHPKIFEIALTRLDVPPSKAVHVGDNPKDDAAGATAAGLGAVLLDREIAFPDFDGRRIETLDALWEALR